MVTNQRHVAVDPSLWPGTCHREGAALQEMGMRNGDGKVVVVKKMTEPSLIIVGVVSPMYREMVFAHVPGNLPVPKVGDDVVLVVHPVSKLLIANRMDRVS